MPRDLNALRAHWSGKRFKRAKAAAAAGPVDLSAHAPGSSPTKSSMCYCRLTKDTINMTKEDGQARCRPSLQEETRRETRAQTTISGQAGSPIKSAERRHGRER